MQSRNLFSVCLIKSEVEGKSTRDFFLLYFFLILVVIRGMARLPRGGGWCGWKSPFDFFFLISFFSRPSFFFRYFFRIRRGEREKSGGGEKGKKLRRTSTPARIVLSRLGFFSLLSLMTEHRWLSSGGWWKLSTHFFCSFFSFFFFSSRPDFHFAVPRPPPALTANLALVKKRKATKIFFIFL